MLYKDIREKETKIHAQVFLNIYIIILNKDKNIQRIFFSIPDSLLRFSCFTTKYTKER